MSRIVFFLGAGASASEGVPLQKDLLPAILDEDQGESLAPFVEAYFGPHMPALEEVFGFIEYLIAHQESLGSHYSLLQLQALRERLIHLIERVIAESQEPGSGVYQDFREVLLRASASVITANYDTLIDEALSGDIEIDYGLPFANREPCRGIRLIKVHGSLNWRYCSSCGQVLLTPPLSSGQGAPQSCAWDGEAYQSLIVPPSHYKKLTHPVVARLRAEAAAELRAAGTVIFVGYSFPAADVHMKALIVKNLRNDCRIVVINPVLDERTKGLYQALRRPLDFRECSFTEALRNPLKWMPRVA